MLFNSRLSATLEYFHKKTDNILISLPAPAVHGTTSLPKVNSAQVSNQGFELTLTWNDRIGNVNYGINANATYVKNNVDKFKGKDKAGMSISGANLIREGHPINSQDLLKVDRIIQTDEDLAPRAEDDRQRSCCKRQEGQPLRSLRHSLRRATSSIRMSTATV